MHLDVARQAVLDPIRRRIVPPEIPAALFSSLAVREPDLAVDRAEPEALIAAALEGRERPFHAVAVVGVGEISYFRRRRQGMKLDKVDHLTRQFIARRRLPAVNPVRLATLTDRAMQRSRQKVDPRQQ